MSTESYNRSSIYVVFTYVCFQSPISAPQALRSRIFDRLQISFKSFVPQYIKHATKFACSVYIRSCHFLAGVELQLLRATRWPPNPTLNHLLRVMVGRSTTVIILKQKV